MRNVPFTLINKKSLQKIKTDSETKENIILSATEFVKEIENGNLDVLYTGEEQEGLLKEDRLAASLVSMRNQMKKIAQQESERKWVTEGLAQFVEILRANLNMLELSDNIIKNLVKYLNANQGILFLLADENPNDIHLQATGCYAYERKKLVEKRINIGEGLAGQSILEKDTIYITEIPDDYIKITSGLGHALPSNVLIVPLKINEVVYGVVEVASFNKFAQYQIDFVEKLSESIASSISSVRTNERTKKLLEETQMQAEQMRAQEEEMRQNMEELSATQEEMQRTHKRTESIFEEIKEKEVYLNNLINATNDAIIAVDKNLKITLFNNYLYQTFAANGLIVEKGMDVLLLTSAADEVEAEKARYERIFRGESVQQTKEYFGKYYRINSQPLKNVNGEIIGACSFTSEVTEQVHAQKKAEELLNQSRQNTEELQAQEEELRQNMEELAATQEEMQNVLKATLEKETYIQSFINATQDAVLAVDKDLKMVAYNAALVNFFGAMGRKVQKGDNLVDYLNKENLDKQLEVYQRTLNGEHFEVVKQYGENTLNIKYDPIRDVNTGEVLGVCCFTRDVTEQMRAQRQTELMKKELEAREEALGVATILSETDALGNILLVSNKLCQVSKYSSEELIGKPHNVLRHPDMPKELFNLLWKTIKAGNTFQAIIKNKTKDNAHYWVDATITTIKDTQGNVCNYMASCYHITDDEVAEQLYNKQAKKLGLPLIKISQ